MQSLRNSTTFLFYWVLRITLNCGRHKKVESHHNFQYKNISSKADLTQKRKTRKFSYRRERSRCSRRSEWRTLDRSNWSKIFAHFCCQTACQPETPYTCCTESSPRASVCPCTIGPKRFKKKRWVKLTKNDKPLSRFLYIYCIRHKCLRIFPRSILCSMGDHLSECS